MQSSSNETKIAPVFPVMGSVQEVLDLGEAKLPITTKNELYSLFMTYHNTLLKTLKPKP